MSKHNFQMRLLLKKPSYMLRYKASGQLPEVFKPDSPLIRLLESIPPGVRSRIVGVTLSPDLGYHSNFSFGTAENLLHWLKPDEYVDTNASCPAESRRDKSFQNPLTLEALKKHTANWPEDYP